MSLKSATDMFEVLRIKLFGTQPTASITSRTLNRIIRREFGNKSQEVKQKLEQVTSETNNGKNRISASILKLSNKDFTAIDDYIKKSNDDFRDVIMKAEYPRCAKVSFEGTPRQTVKQIHLEDWIEYSKWLKK
jgi:hypothetical protein